MGVDKVADLVEPDQKAEVQVGEVGLALDAQKVVGSGLSLDRACTRGADTVSAGVRCAIRRGGCGRALGEHAVDYGDAESGADGLVLDHGLELVGGEGDVADCESWAELACAHDGQVFGG